MSVEQAMECVRAEEWTGDMRVCFNRAISAGRVLAREVDHMRAALKPFAVAYREKCPYCYITFHDLRVAADALTETTSQET